eukprot:Amastigsp_a678055_43.p4 type:complete len:144 gc:universal Amastigsp_a678055_43:481-50(-)
MSSAALRNAAAVAKMTTSHPAARRRTTTDASPCASVSESAITATRAPTGPCSASTELGLGLAMAVPAAIAWSARCSSVSRKSSSSFVIMNTCAAAPIRSSSASKSFCRARCRSELSRGDVQISSPIRAIVSSAIGPERSLGLP